MIKEEVAQFKKLIEKNIGEPIDFMNKLNLPILNALWKVTVGEKFDYDDKKLVDIVKRLTKAFEALWLALEILSSGKSRYPEVML